MHSIVKLFTPLGEPNNPHRALAKRSLSLVGLRVGLLDNGKEFSDIVLESLGESLKVDFRVSEIRFWRKGYPAKLAPFLDEMARESDVAISGVGH
jgi:hypothetical protein